MVGRSLSPAVIKGNSFLFSLLDRQPLPKGTGRGRAPEKELQ